ncbi:MAG: hypothetical protein U5K70_08115 [Halodesulfurarchaeum sp.]|nr:hypothetical protein [Halodesulfurarchaeum sp.]
MSDVLELVAFDIETTGFAVEDKVTVVGFEFEMGTRVFLQVGGDQSIAEDELETRVREASGTPVQLSVHDTERDLLEAVGSFGGSRLADGDLLLVAYNGERWQSGFDLPFLRTRLASHDVDWPFGNVPYADLMPVLNRRFNTAVVDGESVSDLVGVYETLVSGDASSIDPFVDSEEAVAAFETGDYLELVLHNVADVSRTLELGRLSQRYCSKSDFSLKSLTPTVEG